ncbi:thiol:disulfide interchange protein DsbA/DsbL [Campylobacter sp. RM13119]|uniref:thiol:disulfide interchange protein DsbA/DsbL n=1 Tax=Campylobacter TaxID=194 RepID=UPI0014753D5D|nr:MULTISPECIES: thiol:disulfide interchange protein DsbA/DsbL [unclassified Campylobacter]MBE3606907.1 thiol:disulfide interchange protein DsbA/DsbL [Campylobacter sp. RM13119]MBE3610463.1 thiol:disulfide interchange protein DsbA/DsbL [Campylobacter sp. RM12916]
MKILSKAIKLLSVVAIFGALNAAAFSEGKDYAVLEKPLNVGENTLVKVFSYACQYCYKFDKSVTPKIVKELEDMKFMPFHLGTKGSYGETASSVLAALLTKDQMNGVDIFSDSSSFKKAKMAYYKAVHEKGEQWMSKDGRRDKAAFIKTGLDAAGVSLSEYEAILNMPRTQALLLLWNEGYNAAKIFGVPAFVVNGKYVINAAAVTSIKDLEKLIRELQSK